MELKSHPARRVIRAFLLTASIILISFEALAQSNVNVRVMAANLNGNSQKIEPSSIRIYQGLKPDVVAIQEFNYSNNTTSDIRSLVDTAFGASFSYFRETNSGYSIPNGIISRYPIITNSSWTDTQVGNRGFAWAQIDLPGTNDLYIVSVHLLTTSSSARATEAANLKTLIQASFPANAWIVVAGDFNTDSRTETAMTASFDTYLSDFPVPVDNNGNSDTSMNRNHPHDYVLPSFSLTNFETATVLPSHSFPSGLVFDAGVYTPLSDVPPVQSTDSDTAQHMAVIKDFLINAGTNVSSSAPSITAQPQSLAVVLTSNAIFNVSANGTAPLAYQWLFNGTNISGATTNLYSIATVQATNAGNYSVVITNSAGSVTSSVAVLTVVTSPVITTNPVSQSVIQGGTANFSVSAIGIQPLTYQWLFNGTNISGVTTNPFVLLNAQLTNAGNYSVLVTNIAGSVTSSPALLTVNTNVTGTTVLLAGWDTSAQINFGTSPLPPSTNAPNLTIAGLSRGSGVTISGSASAGGWGGNGFDAANATAAATAGDYATFSIAVNTGYTVSFGSISRFDYRRSSTGPATGVLQYQVGAGGFNDITSLSYPTASAGASIGAIDLSGIPSLQNVSSNIVVTFRIVNFGGATAGTWYIYNTISGTAPDLIVQGIINSTFSATNPPASPAILSAPVFSAGQFQMLVTGTATSNYVVQATTNLAPANWTGQFTNASPFTFTDVNLTAPQKFYRAIVRP